MRILMVNWARLRDGAAVGGGVNGCMRELAIELARRGHDVASLAGGMMYTPAAWPAAGISTGSSTGNTSGLSSGPSIEPGPVRGRVEIRRGADFRADGTTPPIRAFEVVNSPIVAPAVFQFRDPRAELGQPALEAEFFRFVALLRPDIAHFHNIEGYSPGCVDVCRAASPGTRVLFTLHNYHTICPQVYLMKRGRVPCRDFDNGHECEGCVDTRTPGEEIDLRLRGFLRENADAAARAGEVERRAALPLRLRIFQRARPAPPPEPSGLPLREGDDVWAEVRGEVPGDVPGHAPEEVVADATAHVGAHEVSEDPPDTTPLDNDPAADPASLRPPNDYALRRGAMIDMLNRCDRVVAVSRFVHEKFANLGVRADVLRTVHIGTRMADGAPVVREDWGAARGGSGGVRLLFIGYNNYYKGLHVLVDALALLPAEIVSRVALTVHAKDVGSIEARLTALGERLASLTVRGQYDYGEIPGLCVGHDLGVVPSVWWDNGPQTVLEFMARGLPVLGANVGGIPDFVRDGENGLLFRANDRADLARVLTRAVREPRLVPSLRVRPPKSMGAHAAEVEALYEECLHEARA